MLLHVTNKHMETGFEPFLVPGTLLSGLLDFRIEFSSLFTTAVILYYSRGLWGALYRTGLGFPASDHVFLPMTLGFRRLCSFLHFLFLSFCIHWSQRPTSFPRKVSLNMALPLPLTSTV